jgi:hypothetical protein
MRQQEDWALQNQFKPPELPWKELQDRSNEGPQLAAGALLFSLGCLWVAVNSAEWYFSQEYYVNDDRGSIMFLVQRYFVAEAAAIVIALVGAYLAYRGLVAWKSAGESESIMSLLAEALSSKRDIQIGVLAAMAYGLAYLLISGVVIFQPGVNSGAWAGISAPGWTAAACCGSVGTVPALIVYLSPQAHLALQILPLDALLAAVVPLLVGFNATVAVHAVRDKAVRSNAGWLSSVGLLAGLFTGCPTCAGLFLAGAVGGLGATSLAVALAPYQMLFILVSIPLLIASPLLVALNARRAQRAACSVPLAAATPA